VGGGDGDDAAAAAAAVVAAEATIIAIASPCCGPAATIAISPGLPPASGELDALVTVVVAVRGLSAGTVAVAAAVGSIADVAPGAAAAVAAERGSRELRSRVWMRDLSSSSWSHTLDESADDRDEPASVDRSRRLSDRGADGSGGDD
jgi:hypothetical protein